VGVNLKQNPGLDGNLDSLEPISGILCWDWGAHWQRPTGPKWDEAPTNFHPETPLADFANLHETNSNYSKCICYISTKVEMMYFISTCTKNAKTYKHFKIANRLIPTLHRVSVIFRTGIGSKNVDYVAVYAWRFIYLASPLQKFERNPHSVVYAYPMHS